MSPSRGVRLTRATLMAALAMLFVAAFVGSGEPAGATALERGGKLPKLTQPDAEHYARASIESKFEYFGYANGKLVRCNKRVSRVRIRCKVKWWIGDASAKGWVTVWYRWKHDDVWWFSHGRVKILDTYCLGVLDKTKSQCTSTKTWGY